MIVKLKTCSDCGASKPVSHFHRRRTSSDGRMSYCAECNMARSTAWANRRKEHLAPKRLAWRQKSPRQSLNVSLNCALRRRPTDRPVSIDQLMEVWERQEGLCALSGIKMTWAQGSVTSTSITIDRINPEIGYEPGNVRLLCHAVNSFRGRMTDREMLAMAKALVANMEP